VKNERPEKVMKWLKSKPTLNEIGAEFPQLLEKVKLDIAGIVADGSAAGLTDYLKQIAQAERLIERKYRSSRGDSKIAMVLVQSVVSHYLAHLSIKQHLIAEATGINNGKVRFNILNGYIAQKLLFSEGLERKPVSLFWFRLLWPLLWQKNLLMPLVQPEGIYCFYSRRLIDELALLIGNRRCLEIAAGDGTLTRFLVASGVNITATDDYSWRSEVKYSDCVVKMDAQDALRVYSPEVVICSWPPAGNGFEHQVFKTLNVQLYVVIGSRHRFAAGNWVDYQSQNDFEFEENEQLSCCVLPPELDAAVYLFRRK
jgi:hypothetical protein